MMISDEGHEFMNVFNDDWINFYQKLVVIILGYFNTLEMTLFSHLSAANYQAFPWS